VNAALLVTMALAALPATARAGDFSLTAAGGSDCPSASVLDEVLGAGQIREGKRTGARPPVIRGFDCDAGPISIGINGKSHLLKDYTPKGLGLPVVYRNEDSSITVYIESLGTIYRDVKNAVEVDAGRSCVPVYQKVRVSVTFEGGRKSILGTAVGNCP
jgi:hypothetical protein